MFKTLGIIVISIAGLSMMVGNKTENKTVDLAGQCASLGGLKMRSMMREQPMVSNVEEIEDRVTPIYHGPGGKNLRLHEGQVLVSSIMSFDHSVEGHRIAYSTGVFNANNCEMIEAKVDAIK